MSKFLDKTPDVRDLEIQLRLNKLCEKDEFFNRGDGSSSNNVFPPPPPPPPPPLPNFPNLRPPPPPSDLFNVLNVQIIDEFLNNNDFNFDFSYGCVLPVPDLLSLRKFAGNIFPNGPSTAKNSSKKNTVGTNTSQAKSGDCLIGDLERVLEKKNPKEEIAHDQNIIFSLPKTQTVLDNEDFEIKQEIKKQKDDETVEEIDLIRLKYEIGMGEIPKEIEFYSGRENYNFFLMCSWLEHMWLKVMKILLAFCHRTLLLRSSGKTCFQYIPKSKIFYAITITHESIYMFLLNQPDETKQINSCYLNIQRFLSKLFKLLS